MALQQSVFRVWEPRMFRSMPCTAFDVWPMPAWSCGEPSCQSYDTRRDSFAIAREYDQSIRTLVKNGQEVRKSLKSHRPENIPWIKIFIYINIWLANKLGRRCFPSVVNFWLDSLPSESFQRPFTGRIRVSLVLVEFFILLQILVPHYWS